MPIFFLISGLFLNTNCDFAIFVKKRFKQLIVPYFYYSIVLVTLVTGKSMILGGFREALSVLKEEIVTVLLGLGITYSIGNVEYKSVGAVWFLIALFEASILTRVFLRMKYGVWVGFFVALISWFSAFYFYLPLSIQAAGIGSAFVYLGNIIKTKRGFCFFERYLKRLFIWGFTTWVLASFFSVNVNLVDGYLSHGPLSCLTSSVISIWIINLCYLLDKSELLFTKKLCSAFCFCGQRSLTLLCVHSLSMKAFQHGKAIEAITQKGINNGIAIIAIVLFDLGISLFFCKIIEVLKGILQKEINVIL